MSAVPRSDPTALWAKKKAPRRECLAGARRFRIAERFQHAFRREGDEWADLRDSRERNLMCRAKNCASPK